MATKYWVGGTGTWDASTTTNWSNSDGGGGGATAPTSSDDVVFNGNSDSGASFTVTVSTGAVCKNFTISGLDQAMTFTGTAAMSVYGSLSFSGVNIYNTYTGTLTFAATSGTQTITSNGVVFSNITFDGVGGTWQLQDDLSIIDTQTLTFTNGTFDLNNFTAVAGSFYSFFSNTRVLTSSVGGDAKIVLTATTTSTIWNSSATTGWSVSGTFVVETVGGGNTTKTISVGQPTESNTVSFTLKNTDGTVAFTANNRIKDLVINGAFTLSNSALSIYGNYTYVTATALTAGANAWTFAATSTKNIISGGASHDFPFTFNGVGGKWVLQDALTLGSTRTLSLTAGTLDLNNLTATVGILSSNNSNTRSINFGTTGQITILSNNTTVLNMATATGFSYTGTSKLFFSYSGSTGTRTISFGSTAGATETNSMNMEVSGGSDTISGANTSCKDLIYTSYTGPAATFTGGIIYGNLYLSVGSTLNAQNAQTIFGATSGTQEFTTNAVSIDRPFTKQGAGTLKLMDNLNNTSTRTFTLTAGTLDLNNTTLTTGLFASSNSNTRSVAFGTGKIVLTATTAVTIWTTSTVTGWSVTGTPLVETTGGGATIKTIDAGSPSEDNTVSFTLKNTAGTIAFTANNQIRNLIINGTFTLSNIAIFIYGNYTYTAATALTAGNSSWTFAGNTGTKTITSNGGTHNFPFTFNGDFRTWQLQDALTLGSTYTLALVAGTLDLNNFTATMGVFSSSNTNLRTLACGSTGKIVSALNNTVILDLSEKYNLTITGTGSRTFQATYSGAVGTRTFYLGSGGTFSDQQYMSLKISAGSDIVSITPTDATNSDDATDDQVLDCDFTGFSGSLQGLTAGSNISISPYGNVICSATMTGNNLNCNFIHPTGSQTLKTNGCQIRSMTKTDVGSNPNTSTLSILDNLSMVNALTILCGTFDANDFGITASSFLSSQGNGNRIVYMKSGTWTISNGYWDVNSLSDSSSLTLYSGTSSLVLDLNSPVFYGGGKTYYNVSVDTQTSTDITIYDSNTFNNLSNVDQPVILYFQAGTTQTFANFGLAGTAGNLVTIQSDTPGTVANFYKSGSAVNANYLAIQDLSVAPASSWQALITNNNSNLGNNYGWIFSLPFGTLQFFVW